MRLEVLEMHCELSDAQRNAVVALVRRQAGEDAEEILEALGLSDDDIQRTQSGS